MQIKFVQLWAESDIDHYGNPQNVFSSLFPKFLV